MAALEAGKRAPAVELSSTTGEKWSLAKALQRGPVALAFFKISCPVCQMTFPYLERIRQAHPEAQLVGISQDAKRDTELFNREYGITFPTLLDDTQRYPVSNAYGITHVPTIFIIEPDGKISLTSVGWVKDDIEAVNRRLAEVSKKPPQPVTTAADPDFKAG